MKTTLRLSYLLLWLAPTTLHSVSSYGLNIKDLNECASAVKETKKILIDAIPGEDALVENALTSCLRLEPNYAEAYLELGLLIFQQIQLGSRSLADFMQASDLILQSYYLDPNNAKTAYQAVRVLEILGRKNEAQELLEKSLQTFKNKAESYLELAKRNAEKNPDEALQHIQEALRLGIGIEELTPVLVSVLSLKYNNNENLADELKKYAKKYQGRWLWHRTAMVYIQASKLVKAKYCFEQAIQQGNNIESRLQYGILLYYQMKEYKKAIVQFKELEQFIYTKESISNIAFIVLYTHLSEAYLLDKNYKESALALERLSFYSTDYQKQLDPLFLEFEKRNALSYLNSILMRLIKEDPLYLTPYYLLAKSYDQKNTLNNSIDMYNQALIIDPQNEKLYAERSLVFFKVKEFLSALSDIDQALKLSPNKSDYLYNKACVLVKLGRNKEAYDFLKIAISLNVNLAKQAILDSDLILLRNDPEFKRFF